MTEQLNTHGYVMRRGKHKGELITRVPVGYLNWMVREAVLESPYAEAELARRGTTIPEFEVSGHAIDSASLRIRRIWHENRGPDEGLHSWLCRVGKEALEKGEKRGDKIIWMGVKWVFVQDGAYPMLKTVMRDKGSEKHGEGERHQGGDRRGDEGGSQGDASDRERPAAGHGDHVTSRVAAGAR